LRHFGACNLYNVHTSVYMASTRHICWATANSLQRWDVSISGHRLWMQSHISDRSFTTAGLQLWHNLPVELQGPNTSFQQFK